MPARKSYFRDCLDYICKKTLTIFRMSLWVLVDDILGISKPAFSMGAITSALKSRYTAGTLPSFSDDLLSNNIVYPKLSPCS